MPRHVKVFHVPQFHLLNALPRVMVQHLKYTNIPTSNSLSSKMYSSPDLICWCYWSKWVLVSVIFLTRIFWRTFNKCIEMLTRQNDRFFLLCPYADSLQGHRGGVVKTPLTDWPSWESETTALAVLSFSGRFAKFWRCTPQALSISSEVVFTGKPSHCCLRNHTEEPRVDSRTGSWVHH